MTLPAPVSACLIVKNEENQIESCLKSIRPHVTEICVIDTGSTDSTPEIVKKYADKFETFTDCNDDQGRIKSFSMARQKSFDLATQPWLFWIDGDDEVNGAENLIKITDEYKNVPSDMPILIMFPYEYSHDEKGNTTCEHFRERLVRPKEAFKWIGPVHEVLNPENSGTTMIKSDKVKIIHRRVESGKIIEFGRNLRILREYYDEVGESDVRHLYYLGLEYGNVGDIGNAIKFHKRYVELSGWDDEKFLASLKIADHYQAIGDYESSIQWALKALTIREGWAEAYFSLSKSYYFMAQRGGPDATRNWQRSVHFAKLGLQLPPTDTILFVNPMERNFEIHRFLNFALNKIGDVDGALESVNNALTLMPDDEGLKGNKKLYEEFVAKREIRRYLDILVKNNFLKSEMVHFINEAIEGRLQSFSLPDIIPISEIKEKLQKNEEDTTESSSDELSILDIEENPKYEIVFYVGPGCEPWNPNVMEEKGIGGSETAVWEMSRRLTKKGHKVKVYGDCENLEGIFDGVEFLHHPNCKNIKCDVFVTSRRPHITDDNFDIKSKIKLCWVHDVNLGAALTHRRALRIDKFLVLSDWHRNFFLSVHPCVHPNQIVVTRNGIDLTRFENSVPRNPHKAVYSSSPDRGLEVAIKAWPKIRKKIPDAELHIYYGFINWEVAARSVGDTGQLNLIEHLKNLMMDYEVHGVIYHGRIDQRQLAKEFMGSGVWAYPTWFSETSCITAMEAQAAGLRMVTSPIAALNETVANRGVMIPGDWLAADYMEKFVNAIVEAMTKEGDEDREKLKQYACDHFGMDELANDWDQMIGNIIEEIERDVVPPYKPAV
jgi:glycosyltransferase involved in cell wall biosynthesis